MPTNTARLRDNIAALAALRYDQAQITDGRVSNPQAAAILLQAVQVHVHALIACAPRPTPARAQSSPINTATMTDVQLYAYYHGPDRRLAVLSAVPHVRDLARASGSDHEADGSGSGPFACGLAGRAERRRSGPRDPAIGTAEWHRQTFGEPPDPAV